MNRAVQLKQVQSLHVVLAAVLLPALLEALDPDRFTIAIDNVPLSVGRMAFVLCGMVLLITGGSAFLRTKTFLGLMLVTIGTGLGALFSDNLTANLTRTVALGLLVVGACGVAYGWTKKPFRLLLDVLMVALLVYWMSYTLSVWVQSGFRSYTDMYLAGAPLINHHVPGVYVSVSTVYLAHRFFYRGGHLALGGYLVFGFGLLGCLILESRSNFLFTGVALLVALYRERRRLGRLVYVVAPAIVAVVVILQVASSSNQGIRQRFAVTDLDYQQRSTDSRLRFVAKAGEVMIQKPMGSGIRNIMLHIDNKRLLVHNQYLSFMLAGGVVALVGLLLWGRDFFVSFKRMTDPRLKRPDEIYLVAPGMVALAFYATLLTIELSGMLFFLVVSLGIYLSGVMGFEYRTRNLLAADRARAELRRTRRALERAQRLETDSVR